MSATPILIGCGRAKLAYPAPARELYTGCLFRAARRYAEESGRPWAIVSGLHGLVMPDQVLEPYDSGWTDQAERRLPPQLAAWIGSMGGLSVEIHAGRAYAETIRLGLWMLRGPIVVTEPLDGLTVGRRLAWYKARRLA